MENQLWDQNNFWQGLKLWRYLSKKVLNCLYKMLYWLIFYPPSQTKGFIEGINFVKPILTNNGNERRLDKSAFIEL